MITEWWLPNRGERHGMHRLTEDDVPLIYARRHEPARLLAAEFGVSRQCINHVTSGRRWAWLTAGSGSVSTAA
jgi:hypothetical protein